MLSMSSIKLDAKVIVLTGLMHPLKADFYRVSSD